MGHILPFELLRTGDRGEVVAIHGDAGMVRRLAEKGLRHGSRLEMLTPGEPAVCRVGETRLSLGCRGQVEIMVQMP